VDDDLIEPDLPVQIAVVEDGPLWLEGGISVQRSDGIQLELRNRVTLCRCGSSANKPLCDGSHRESKSSAETRTTAKTQQAGPPSTFGRIVVGAKHASGGEPFEIAVAVALAGDASSQLDIVHLDSDAETGERTLDELSHRAIAAGLPAEHVSTVGITGHPADAIAETAEDLDAGLIVMGRGGSKPSRTVHRLASKAPCDLLVVAATHRDLNKPYRRVTIATAMTWPRACTSWKETLRSGSSR
jgi:CDGSH-type Zn-finger protein/nucleotide-binding universal stress UspA family protein